MFHCGIGGGLFLVAGCAGPGSALDPAGPAARAIAQLWWAMFWGGAVLFLLVMGLFALTMLRPAVGARVSARRWIILGGIVLPVPILAVLTFHALIQGERLLVAKNGGEVPFRVEAHARQWQWEFRYPDLSGAPATQGVLHIPAGRPIEIVATSVDVIHSFWVPRLGGKIDATPGHATRIRIFADRPGQFSGVCAEYCGTGHSGMRFRVEAHEVADFTALAERGFRQ